MRGCGDGERERERGDERWRLRGMRHLGSWGAGRLLLVGEGEELQTYEGYNHRRLREMGRTASAGSPDAFCEVIAGCRLRFLSDVKLNVDVALRLCHSLL